MTKPAAPAATAAINANATRSTYKGHGKPETFLYFGRDGQLDGDLVKLTQGRGAITFLSLATGRRYEVDNATKFWAAPAS